jgi:GNAT superfamily N-acetyltransferase
MAVTVRQMRDSDLTPVVAAMGQHAFFTDRLARQADGHGIMLVAVDGETVCGDVYLWLAEVPEFHQHLPGVPVLNHLEVAPALRSRGIGTLLVRTAEQWLRELGHDRVALGVAIDNRRAHALYEQLGYIDWGHGTVAIRYEVPGDRGLAETITETIHVLVKDLRTQRRGR